MEKEIEDFVSVEYWDVYDKDKRLTGKVIKRGERLNEGEYHLFVQVWLFNSHGEFLVQKRSKNMKWPGMYCANGGNAKVKEDGITCARRELKEELGLDLDSLSGGFFDTRLYHEDGQDYFCDSFIYFIDKEIKDIKYQEYEIEKLEYMKMDEIKRLMEDKIFFVYDYDYLDYVNEYANKYLENKKTKTN